MWIGPELLVTLVNSRVFQVMLLLHVTQQVLHIGVLLLAEATVLLHLQMDALYMDLRQQIHRIKTYLHDWWSKEGFNSDLDICPGPL